MLFSCKQWLIGKILLFWYKAKADNEKELDNDFAYNNFFLKTKIKSYGDEATDFHDKEIPKTVSDCTCLAVITTDSFLTKEENHYYCYKCFCENN